MVKPWYKGNMNAMNQACNMYVLDAQFLITGKLHCLCMNWGDRVFELVLILNTFKNMFAAETNYDPTICC